MLKLSLRSESCKHSWMLWGTSTINPRKANGFKGFQRRPQQGDCGGSQFCVCISFLFYLYRFLINTILLLSLCHSMPILTHLPSKKLSPSLPLWCLPVCSVVRGLLFSQVGEGHVLQMDMSCGAMPSQLHGREPWGLEQSSQADTEKGELSLARRVRMLPGPCTEKTDRKRKRWREDRKGVGWQGDVDGTGRQIYSTALKKESCGQWTLGSHMGYAQKPISDCKSTFHIKVLMCCMESFGTVTTYVGHW